MQGVPGPLPGGMALAAYRIVQESLTNTRKHGGPAARAEVLLRYCEDVLVLRITDDGHGATAAADGAGHGLTGMRERVALYGGTLRAGPGPMAGTRSPLRLPWSGSKAGGRASRRGAGKQSMIKILLVDDQELVGTGFRMVLDARMT